MTLQFTPRRTGIPQVACVLFLFAGGAGAAPLIDGAVGQVTHKSSLTIKGSGFGTKNSAAPVVWDDASTGTSLYDKWSGFWPSNSSNSSYNMAYRTPMRNIGLPHNNITRYIAGAHGNSSGASGGYNVMLWKSRTMSTFPSYTYASWYQRSDDNWSFCGDNNYKVFDYSANSSPYRMPENWYLEYNPRPTSRSSTPSWHMLDDSSSSLQNPDANGHSWWWNSAVNPMSGKWSKIEVEIRYSNRSDGYIKLWENGLLRVNYAGRTDGYPGTSRSEAIGGYARCYGYSNNWRYFADLYLDYSRARVVLANNADYSKATVIETQVPTSWKSDSVNVAVNLGKFSAGETAYLFLFDGNGQRNAAGFPVKVGSGVATRLPPDQPTGLTVTVN